MSISNLSAHARPLVLGLVAFAATAVFFLPTVPARAEQPSCDEVWDHLVTWSADEAAGGVSAIGLEDLHSLLPEVEACSRPISGGTGVGPETWRALAGVYFDSGEVDRVVCLIGKESGGDPNARNRSSGASGLLQVMPGWADDFGYEPGDLFDPVVNMWVASRIRAVQGWSAWSPYQRGLCR